MSLDRIAVIRTPRSVDNGDGNRPLWVEVPVPNLCVPAGARKPR
jgi:hypothetical protein